MTDAVHTPSMLQRLARCLPAGLVLLAGLPLLADEPRAGDSKPEPLVYVPPDVGAPPTRTLAAVRGRGDPAALQVLAPEQTGLTREEQPTLFWYLPAPSEVPVEVTLIDDRSVEPLLEAELGPIDGAGLHALDLAAYDVQLEPGVEYQWAVAQVVDPGQRSADLVSSATIAHRPGGPAVPETAGGSPPMDELGALAGAGYWYDVVALLAEAIAADPGNTGLRQLRADLLEQVGLDAAAAFERGAIAQ